MTHLLGAVMDCEIINNRAAVSALRFKMKLGGGDCEILNK